MDIRWLQDFLALAELGNFTKAAEARHLSQAAFSRRIQGLEQWLGAQLIDRNSFPTVLTEAGERFCATAREVTGKLADARSALGAKHTRDQIRIALPYALATTRFPDWWKRWSLGHPFCCTLELGNVHDTVSALIEASVDIVVCFQQAAVPIQLDLERFERIELGTDWVKPYAARGEVENGRIALVGDAFAPMPLLMYSPTVYFARVVDAAIEAAPVPIHGTRVFEAEMSDVLGDLASSGLGIAWLPDSSFRSHRNWNLVALGEGKWDIEVSILAYKARANNRAGIAQLWSEIAAGTGAPPQS